MTERRSKVFLQLNMGGNTVGIVPYKISKCILYFINTRYFHLRYLNVIQMYFEFLIVCSSSFILFKVYFTEYKILILIGSNLTIFYWVIYLVLHIKIITNLMANRFFFNIFQKSYSFVPCLQVSVESKQIFGENSRSKFKFSLYIKQSQCSCLWK